MVPATWIPRANCPAWPPSYDGCVTGWGEAMKAEH